MDRFEFMNWTKGIVLDRRLSYWISVDDALCKRAYRDLKKGGTVILMVRNRPYSRVKLKITKEHEEYTETLL